MAKSSSKPALKARSAKSAEADAALSQAPIVKRSVDLGREEELVTWNEWFERSGQVMQQAVPKEMHERLAFRLTLGDRRQFIVRQVLTHVARGKCTIGPSRWNEREAICDVITGYMFVGRGSDDQPSALCVPPTYIRALECILLPDESEQPHPFGFYKRDEVRVPHERKEVEETLVQAAI